MDYLQIAYFFRPGAGICASNCCPIWTWGLFREKAGDWSIVMPLLGRESRMRLRSGIAVCFVASAIAASTGCATGGTSEVYQTFMQKCLANAKTKDERSQCAWKNAERMASGN